jgi:hypothetical protein
MIFNELLVDTKVEFKLKPNKGTKNEKDAQEVDMALGGYIERDFVATDIVVKEEKEKMNETMQGTVFTLFNEKGL